MVTHHVEEILPCITHVLMLREGKVLAAGEKKQVLTSENLSTLYGSPVKISRVKDRYYLRLVQS
jgi:iron complex transport system ATP-binding protein